jgi:hypothetical protein
VKRIVMLVAVAGGVLAARRAARSCGRPDFGKWIAAMPDDAPPKWMFNNISAIRANTERILDLMARPAADGPEAAHAGTAEGSDV